MKKLLTIVFAVLFIASIFTVPAMALDKDGPGLYEHSKTHTVKYFKSHPGLPSQWQKISDDPEPPADEGSTVTGSYFVHPWDFNESLSTSGNDFGYAGGESMIGGEIETFADATGYGCHWVQTGRFFWEGHWEYTPNEATEGALLYGESETKAWSWAHDSGLTSKAGAGIKADGGYVLGLAYASGKGGDKEFVSTRLAFGANFYQNNGANEVGYLAGGVTAYNQSGLEYLAFSPWETYEHKDYVVGILASDYTPDVITKGKSEVTIDPYGDTRSFNAMTENMSNIAFTGCNAPNVTFESASVYGNGVVSGVISNGSAVAGGTATFNYNGYTAGNGSANMYGTVTVNQNSTSAYVSGSSSAVAN